MLAPSNANHCANTQDGWGRFEARLFLGGGVLAWGRAGTALDAALAVLDGLARQIYPLLRAVRRRLRVRVFRDGQRGGALGEASEWSETTQGE